MKLSFFLWLPVLLEVEGDFFPKFLKSFKLLSLKFRFLTYFRF